MEKAAWIRQSSIGQPIRVSIYVQPGARVSEIAGFFDQSLMIKIASPPSDGAANETLREFVAEILGINARQVEILQGTRSRHKILSIEGSTVEEILAKLRV